MIALFALIAVVAGVAAFGGIFAGLWYADIRSEQIAARAQSREQEHHARIMKYDAIIHAPAAAGAAEEG